MEKKETKIQIYKALMEVQGSVKPIVKGQTADTGKFSYSYADLATVLDAVTPELHKNGLVVLQPTDIVEGKPVLVTTIVHAESGKSVEGRYPIVAVDDNDPQKIGASVTYARRYGLLAMLGLATEDDDALSASGHSKGASSSSSHAAKPAVNKATGEVIGQTPEDTPAGACSHCGVNVPGKSVYWSNKKHGRTLCWNDQKLAEAGELDDPKNNVSSATAQQADAELDSLFARQTEGS